MRDVCAHHHQRHRLLLLHTVCATYVPLHPSVGRGKASGPATLPRARAAYVGEVGTVERGAEWLGGQQMASPEASAGVAGGVHACGWKVGSKWRCVRFFVRRRSVSEGAAFSTRKDGRMCTSAERLLLVTKRKDRRPRYTLMTLHFTLTAHFLNVKLYKNLLH